MSKERFDHLLSIIRDEITKKDTPMRKAISAEERLIITLRFLSAGMSQQTLRYNFRVGRTTVSTGSPRRCVPCWNVSLDWWKLVSPIPHLPIRPVLPLLPNSFLTGLDRNALSLTYHICMDTREQLRIFLHRGYLMPCCSRSRCKYEHNFNIKYSLFTLYYTCEQQRYLYLNAFQGCGKINI